MAVFTIFRDFPIAATQSIPSLTELHPMPVLARYPRAKPYIATKDKMLDYIVAQFLLD